MSIINMCYNFRRETRS